LLLGHKTQQQIEWRSNLTIEPSFLALLNSSEPSFEYSIAFDLGTSRFIYLYTYLCLLPRALSSLSWNYTRALSRVLSKGLRAE
jgi:hypothetical protein